jgi:hypothetical protein
MVVERHRYLVVTSVRRRLRMQRTTMGHARCHLCRTHSHFVVQGRSSNPPQPPEAHDY